MEARFFSLNDCRMCLLAIGLPFIGYKLITGQPSGDNLCITCSLWSGQVFIEIRYSRTSINRSQN